MSSIANIYQMISWKVLKCLWLLCLFGGLKVKKEFLACFVIYLSCSAIKLRGKIFSCQKSNCIEILLLLYILWCTFFFRWNKITHRLCVNSKDFQFIVNFVSIWISLFVHFICTKVYNDVSKYKFLSTKKVVRHCFHMWISASQIHTIPFII